MARERTSSMKIGKSSASERRLFELLSMEHSSGPRDKFGDAKPAECCQFGKRFGG
jgi:hypothetical protein